MFEILEKDQVLGAKIKVVGVGGGGTNAIATMISRYKSQEHTS